MSPTVTSVDKEKAKQPLHTWQRLWLAAKVTKGSEPFNIYDTCRITEITYSLVPIHSYSLAGEVGEMYMWVFDTLVITITKQGQ